MGVVINKHINNFINNIISKDFTLQKSNNLTKMHELKTVIFL